MEPTRRLDLAGATLSSLCALHCLLIPLVAGALPVAALHGSERLEAGLLGLSILVALIASYAGWRLHRRGWTLAIVAAAIAAIVAGRALGEGQSLGRVLVIAGALGLAGSHLCNRYLCRCAGCGTPTSASGCGP